jgi:hypothetical protein
MDRDYSRFVILGLLCSAAVLASVFVASDHSGRSELQGLDLADLQRLKNEHLTTAQMMAEASKCAKTYFLAKFQSLLHFRFITSLQDQNSR